MRSPWRTSDNPNYVYSKCANISYTKYINIIAYPPRPETFIDLPEVKEDDPNYEFYKDRDSLLRCWASGHDFGDYLPPSAYIPIATT
jgi:hypothetical protein